MNFYKELLTKLSKKFLIVLLILYINIGFIAAENCRDCEIINYKCVKKKEECPDGVCICDEKCRPHLYSKEGTCYDCSEVINDPSTKYSINNGVCQSVDQDDCQFFTVENNECVDNCGDGYIIETIIDDKAYQRCTGTCPSGYYDFRSKKCVPGCQGDTDKITEDKGCTDYCLSSEFLFIQTETINGKRVTKKYCLKKCPDQARFFYSSDHPLKDTECRTECEEGHFYSEENYECKSSCDDKISYIDVSTNTFQCTRNDLREGEEYFCGESSYPYQYKSSCLRTCEDTKKLDIFLKKPTYSLIIRSEDEGEIEKKLCSEDCRVGDSEQYFFDSITLSCHKSCDETSHKYFYGNECLESCDKIQQHPYYLPSGKCVNKCSEGNEGDKKYYLLKEESACYESCPAYSENKYINKKFLEDGECTKCDIPKNPTNIGYEEGYIFKEGENLFCINSCSEKDNEGSNIHYYYANDNNICFSESDDYKYAIGDEDYKNNIRYKSCKDIPGNFIHQFGNECYKDIPRTIPDTYSKYYFIESNIYKYSKVEEKDSFCSNNGFSYKRKITEDSYECVSQCNSEEYISNDECLPNCPNRGNIYYSENEKICRESCPYKIIKENEDLKTISGIGNCVIECPSGYEYISEDGKSCLNNCPQKYYITNEGKKKCIQDCKTISKFSFNDNPECLEQCYKEDINNNKVYYYYDDNNICHKNCKENTGKTFAIKAEKNGHQPCIQECPEGTKYYSSDNICLKECENGYIKGLNNLKECVSSCYNIEDAGAVSDPPCIIRGNICSDKCTKEEPFYFPKIVDLKTIYKCVSNCELENNSFKFYKKKENVGEIQLYECLPSCSAEEKENGKECVNECPDGFYEENGKCKTSCSNNLHFKYDNDNKNYKCVETCGGSDFINSLGECVPKCPIGENYIGVGNQCKSKCDPYIDGEYYSINGITQPTDEENYKIYKCSQTCSNYALYGTKECVSACNGDRPYKSESEKICYSLCLNSENYPFTPNDSNECKQDCGDQYFQEDKKCVSECTGINDIINDKDKSCVNKCDTTSLFKYLKKIDSKDHCSSECTKYTPNDYKCYEGEVCPEPYNFIVGNECLKECPKDQFANPVGTDDPPKEYICKSRCEVENYDFYYEKEKICLNDCKPNDFNIQYTNKCVKSCNEISDENTKYYHYEKKDENSIFQKNTCVTECPNDKEFKDKDNYCRDKCKFTNYEFYIPSEKVCREDCPYKKNGNECLQNCPQEGNKFSDELDNCVESCLSSNAGYYYYYDSDKKCRKNCGSDFIYNQYECVSSCLDKDEKYIYNKNCIGSCPREKKYFIGAFEHGEADLNIYCLTDCPEYYPFYTIESNGISCKCSGSCSTYYISSKDPKVIAKQCVDLCEGDYKFYNKHNATHKECLEICPNGKRYYIQGDTNVECYEKCPATHPYHERNSFECIESCDSKYANYTTKECLYSCDINNFRLKDTTPDDKEITLCLNNCNENELTPFYTLDNECVKECDEQSYFRGNNKGVCECMNLYYYDDDGKIKCFNTDIQKCGEEGKDSKDYPIQISGTGQCVKNCFGILSASETECYLGEVECPKNTKKGIYNNKVKCECKYKYYIDENKVKICLDEENSCPDGYNYLVPETNECVKNCDGKIEFDNKCLDSCPSPLEETEDHKSCQCSENWYKDSNKYICLAENEVCPNKYPYLSDKKECVNKCDKGNFNILDNKKCVDSCDENKIKVPVDNGISKFICRCKNAWTKDECPSTEKKCTEISPDLKYQVKETKECVQNCPEGYFFFNNECFKDCDQAKEYGYDVKKNENNENSKECICEYYTKIIEEDSNNLYDCVDSCDGENEIVIERTNQCIEKTDGFKCPHNSPYLYNKICYINCPEGTSIDNTKGGSCKCNNIWVNQGNDIIYCAEKEDEKCPDSHPYLILNTNECVNEDGCNGKKIFNYTCYEKCPYSTKDGEDENNCVCNENKYWYKYKSSDSKEYFVCGLEECPDSKPYFNNKKECLKNCGDEGLVEYANECFTECPTFTKPNINDNSICEFTLETEDFKDLIIDEPDKLLEKLPKISDSGLLVTNDEATLQIYGLKKENINNKEKIESLKRTNLAYIDLSGCLEKLYKSNGLKDGEDIIVVKLDLKSNNKKLMVNPVEYEFINSVTGKVLDASVCDKNEVVISYPITYMLNNKKNKRNLEGEEDPEVDPDEEEKNEILDKFSKGKTLNEKDSSIDTFNFNNPIYKDICKPVELDGKDIILEERIQHLFPNYSFCESMCDYDYTNFQDERIYCNCSIKTEINIDREHSVKIYQYNEKEIKSNQKGPTNLPILKCISKAKISGNGAFIFCIIFIVLEIGLLMAIIFHGINALINKIKIKVINGKENNNLEYNNSENDKIKENKIDKTSKFDNNISSTKRNMKANPPKSGKKNEEKEDIKITDDIISIKKANPKSNILTEKNFYLEDKNNLEANNNAEKEVEFNKYLQKNEVDTQTGFFQSMKQEEKLLRTKFSYSLENDRFEFMVVILTSIFDKIYLVKVLLLPGKFDIISLTFSLYLLYHILLLTFVTFFYDIETIRKILKNDDYPSTNYYLSYGFLANIIVWIIYRLFCCLLNNEHKIKKLYSMNNLDRDRKKEKTKNIIYKIKRNIIIYLVLQFLVIMFCSFYLITFCGIYLGTKKEIFTSYGIAIIEIIIIKIVYGFILGIFRKVSLYKNISILYNIALIFNKYIS